MSVALSEQILTSLRHKLKGMLVVMWAGWLEVGNRYWQRSVGFLYISVIRVLFLIVTRVSKKGKERLEWQKQSCFTSTGYVQGYGHVKVLVNFIVGCRVLTWFRNSCRSSTLPRHIKKMSSRNLFSMITGSPVVTTCRARVLILTSIS
jgi:hypothetical protein